MSSSDIYDDLHNTDLGEAVVKLKEEKEKLLSHIRSLQEDIEKLCQELVKMKKTEDNLKQNISSLFKTSKLEVERKDRMIADLRRELDDLIFRRSGCSGGPNFNKRRHDSPNRDSNAYKKPKLNEQTVPEIFEPSVKNENHVDIKKECGGKKSRSKSPPRQGSSRSSYRPRDGRRSKSKEQGIRSRSKERAHRSRSKERAHRSRSKERGIRSRSKEQNIKGRSKEHSSYNRNKDYKSRDSNRRNEALHNYNPKKELSTINEKSEINCDTVINGALHRISNKHITSNNVYSSTNSKTGIKECEKSMNNNSKICSNSEINPKGNGQSSAQNSNYYRKKKENSPVNDVREFTDPGRLTKEEKSVPSPAPPVNHNRSSNIPSTAAVLDIPNTGQQIKQSTENSSDLSANVTDVKINSNTSEGFPHNVNEQNTSSNQQMNKTVPRRRRCVIKILT